MKIHLLCRQKIRLAIPCSKFHRRKLWFWLHFWQKSHEALIHQWLPCFHTIGPQNHYFPFPLRYKHPHIRQCMAHSNYEMWPINKVQVRSEICNILVLLLLKISFLIYILYYIYTKYIGRLKSQIMYNWIVSSCRNGRL